MRAFLAESQTVTETAAAKDETRSVPRYLKTRTLQDVPAERTADDEFEIPPTHDLLLLACDGNELGATRIIVLRDGDLIEMMSNVGAGIGLEGAQQIGT
jgi:hypothetical protein